MSGYIIKVTLEGTHPPVWRRLAIPDRLCFSDLHRIIQVAFGWHDMHLHEFTFPNLDLCVTPPDEDGSYDDYDDDVMPEDAAVVDDFFSTNPWFRYTYDFGDDWRHKITLEKEDPSYSQRYGTVLKAKGSNFEEDSGGVYAQAQQEEPYDIPAVNQILSQLEAPAMPPSKESAAAANGDIFFMEDWMEGEEEEEEELNQMFQQMERLYIQSRREYEAMRADPPSSSALGKMRAEWSEFCLDWDAWEDWASKNPEDAAAQEEGYFLDKKVTPKTRCDLLGQASQAELRDYCKYLQIPWKRGWNKKRLAEGIVQCLDEHPEYIAYVLDGEELAALQQFCREPEGRLEDWKGEVCVERAIALGMAEVRIGEEAKGAAVACLEISQEAQDFLLSLESRELEPAYQRLAAVNKRVQPIIVAYGLIEAEEVCRMLEGDEELLAGREEILRAIYWHGRFNGLIQAKQAEDGKEYVATVDMDMEKVWKDRQQYASDVEYPGFTTEELVGRVEVAVGEVPGWSHYAKLLKEVGGLEGEFWKDWLDIVCTDVRNGDTSTQLVIDTLEIYEPSTLMEWTELWLSLMEICMNTPLPMLKGYSRAEFAEATGKSAYALGLFDEDLEDAEALEEIKEELHPEDHLFMLPAEWQSQLLEAGRVADGGHSLEGMKRILGQSKANHEMAFLMMNGYIHARKFREAKRLAQDLKARLRRRDASLEKALEFLADKKS